MADKERWKWLGRFADLAAVWQLLFSGSVVTAVSKFLLDIPTWQAVLAGANAAFLTFAFGVAFRYANKLARTHPALTIPPATADGSKTGLTIHSALWGAKGSYRNLTGKLTDSIQSNQISIPVRFPDDPIPHEPKLLIVLYSFGANPPHHYIALREGDHLTISEQSVGASTLRSQDLFIANEEADRLKAELSGLKTSAKQMADRVSAAHGHERTIKHLESELEVHKSSAEALRSELSKAKKSKAELSNELAAIKLFNLGNEFTPKPRNVLIWYDSPGDEKISKDIADFFNHRVIRSPWSADRDRHLFPANPNSARIVISAEDMKLARALESILNKSGLLAEPFGIGVEHLMPADVGIRIFAKI